MFSFLLLALVSSRLHRNRRHRSKNGDTEWPYFIASKRYEPADFPEDPDEELPLTEGEKVREEKIRKAKKKRIQEMVADEVAKLLAEMGFTSSLGQQLILAKQVNTILDFLINSAEAALRRRRRVRF